MANGNPSIIEEALKKFIRDEVKLAVEEQVKLAIGEQVKASPPPPPAHLSAEVHSNFFVDLLSS
jgi:hypothetical protein